MLLKVSEQKLLIGSVMRQADEYCSLVVLERGNNVIHFMCNYMNTQKSKS